MTRSWVLGLDYRDHKGILSLEIASDLQQDTMYVFLPCLTAIHRASATDASGITPSTGSMRHLAEQVT